MEQKPYKLKPELRHVSYAVTSCDETVKTWSKYFDFGPWTFRENGGLDAKGRPWKIKMAFAYVNGIEVELVECSEGKIFQTKFMEKWGEGIHHIGFHVDDVDKETDNLVKQGVKLFVHDPGKFSYLDAGGVGGAVFELMKRPSGKMK